MILRLERRREEEKAVAGYTQPPLRVSKGDRRGSTRREARTRHESVKEGTVVGVAGRA